MSNTPSVNDTELDRCLNDARAVYLREVRRVFHGVVRPLLEQGNPLELSIKEAADSHRWIADGDLRMVVIALSEYGSMSVDPFVQAADVLASDLRAQYEGVVS